MSDNVICPACSAENATGSKFCNNCGNRLPPSDKIICPSCQTPNPANRYYCDHCGSRLVDKERSGTEDAPEPEDVGDTAVFSLPTRKPGDTGELDPSSVPDWLRTGKLGGEDEEDEPPSEEELTITGKLPRIEELTSEKKGTADLPDWLVGEHDSEPIIEAPPITTEYYQDLLNGSSDDEVLSAEEAAEAREAANLPGWLTEADQSGGQESVDEESDQPSEELSDWLAELGREAEADFEADADEGQPEAAGEPASGELDWLAELGPPHTETLSKPEGGNGDELSGSGLVQEPLPDWLAELGPPNTEILSSPEESQEFTAGPAEDLGDWDFDFDPDSTDILSQPGDEDETPVEEQGSEPDWLFDYDVLQTGALPPQDDADASEPDDEFPITDEETGYSPQEAEESEVDFGVQDEDETDSTEEDTEEISEWLSKLTSEEPDDLIPLDDDEHLPDWLAEPTSSAPEAGSEIDSELKDQVDELIQAGDLQMTAWMSNLAGVQEDDDLIESGEENLPEWLRQPKKPEEQAPAPGEAEQEVQPTDIPDWLTEPGFVDEERVEDAGPAEEEAEEEGTEEISEWLSKLTSEEPDDLIPLDGEELPDWLADQTPSSFDTDSEVDTELEEQVDELMEAGDLQMTAWLSNLTRDEPEDELASLEGDEDLPDWLTEPSDSGLEAQDEGEGEAAEEVHAEEAIPAWLTEPGILDEEGIPPEASSATDEQLEEREAIENSELPDWLQPPAEIAEGMADRAEKPAEEDVARWMDELESAVDDDGDALFEELAEDFQFSEEPPGEPAGQMELGPEEDSDAGLIDAWFTEMEEEVGIGDRDAGDDLIDDLFAVGELNGDSDLDWLTQPETRDRPATEPDLEAPDLELDEPQAETAEPEAALEEQPLAEVPDWLSELESLDSGIFAEEVEEPAGEAPEPEPEDAADEPVGVEAAGEADLPAEEITAEETPEPGEIGEEAWFGDDELLEQAEEAMQVPEWMDELGAPMADQPVDSTAPDDTLASDELPEWVASLRPTSDSDMGSLLPSALVDEGDLSDLAAEMGEAELPDWLHSDEEDSSGLADQEETAVIELPGVPAWLKGAEGVTLEGAFPFLDEDDETSSEWANVLGELPSAVPLIERLARSDIPEWVQELKPREESEAAEPETTGPLSGMRGVVSVEPIITKPHAAHAISQFTVTKEQQQQAALLRQLVTHAEEKAEAVALKPVRTTSPWLRIVLALLLVAVIIVGLMWPDFLQSEPLPLTPEVEAVDTLISAAAGQPVLVAVEYSPAMAGELTSPGSILVDQLAANESPIITVSQFAAGTAIASELTQGLMGHNLGLIPGEAIGLRQLGHCLSDERECSNILGRPIGDEVRQMLAEVGLVVVLTGERDSLVNWIEQVGAVDDTPLVAGITQSLRPVAAPYQAAGQLQGVLVSIGDASIYQREFQLGDVNAVIQQKLITQNLARLLIAVVLIIGGVFYGTAGRSTDKSKASTSRS